MATNTGVIDLVKPAGNENALISVINSNMDKIDAEAGRARANVAANYSDSSAYAVGDLCIYQGSLYRCNTAIGSGGESWTAGHWTQVNIAGELAALNDHIATLNSNSLHFIETVSTISDCNSLASGCGYTSTNALNSPENYSYIIALNFNGDVFQIALGSTTSNTFIRRCIINVWTAWKRFSFAS